MIRRPWLFWCIYFGSNNKHFIFILEVMLLIQSYHNSQSEIGIYILRAVLTLSTWKHSIFSVVRLFIFWMSLIQIFIQRNMCVTVRGDVNLRRYICQPVAKLIWGSIENLICIRTNLINRVYQLSNDFDLSLSLSILICATWNKPCVFFKFTGTM